MDLVTGVLGDMGSLFSVFRDYLGPFLFSEAQNLASNAPNVPIPGSFSSNLSY